MNNATKHTPATPLPYRVESEQFKIKVVSGPRGKQVTFTGRVDTETQADAAYIAHAANAYPKLVEALRELERWTALATRGELAALTPQRESARALLRELGESA